MASPNSQETQKLEQKQFVPNGYEGLWLILLRQLCQDNNNARVDCLRFWERFAVLPGKAD